MSSIINDIRETLQSAGWLDLSIGTLRYLDLVLRRSFAVVGVLCPADGADAIRRWKSAQGELAELREGFGRSHDVYLLICVPQLDSATIEQLPGVIGDTHVCRKLVIELRNRPAEEALLDVPLLVWKTPEEGPDDLVEATLPESEIPPLLLEDLGMKAPARVLDAWLEGRYNRPTDDAD